MLMNRHFFVVIFSIFFIGVIFWWQKPVTAVSAMAGAGYQTDPYQIVKSYWTKMDYRQFDLSRKMVAATALAQHDQLQKELTDNPFLSIQKVVIENAPAGNACLAKVTTGSAIDPQKEVDYLMNVGKTANGTLITSIQAIP
jgi:hypothetical protein